jgi:L-seryl-tRNA(Ser) seleniumtransferase
MPTVRAAFGDAFEVAAAPMTSQVGSGAMPADRLPSFGLRVTQARAKGSSLNRLEGMLRELPRPVLGRISDKALWLDVRCLEITDEAEFTAQWSAFHR